MEICVFGAGSLGSLLGGLLAQHHEVTLVGRQPHAGQVRADGLRITGERDLRTRPNATTTVPACADVALVTVKSFDTPAAATALADCEVSSVLSLQNGMGNEEQLATAVEAPVLAGVCTYGARLTAPGSVEWTGRGEITLGPREGGRSTVADQVGEILTTGGLTAAVSTTMPQQLWRKLAVNAGINAATALAQAPNGAVTTDPGAWVARRAAREVATVAASFDVALSPEQATTATVSVAETTAQNWSSMRQDIDQGTRTEVDAINGYVLDQASTPVPVNETLTRLVRVWEQARGLRDSS